MAVRNDHVVDSIHSLIYMEKRGGSRGYRRDLVTENIPHKVRKYVFCSHCQGISKKPRFSKDNSYCTVCSIDVCATFDVIVEEFIQQLKCRCPLSTRGCDWVGQLLDIENHMSVCGNLKIECGIGCGRVLERCDITRHHVLCPLRTQASKAERPIKFCQEHANREMIYPKKEVLDNPTGCLIGRHMVEQQDIRLLKSEVNRLREKSEREELETSRKIQCLTRNGVNLQWKVWTLFLLFVTVIAIILSLLHTQGYLHANIMLVNESTHSNKQDIQSVKQATKSSKQDIQSVKQSTESNKQDIQFVKQSTESNKQDIQFVKQSTESSKQDIQSVKQSTESNKQDIQSVKQSTESNKQDIQSVKQSTESNKQDIQFVKQSTESNKQDIQSNKRSILSHEQLTYSLLSRGIYLHEYIEDRDMTLQGVEWIHRTVKGETIYGPTFHMRECKLRLHVLSKRNQLDVEYYVTRLEGRYDVTSSCHITGFVVYLVNALDSTESSFRHKTHDIRLGVRDQYKIETKYFTKDGIRILKVYFDVE